MRGKINLCAKWTEIGSSYAPWEQRYKKSSFVLSEQREGLPNEICSQIIETGFPCVTSEQNCTNVWSTCNRCRGLAVLVCSTFRQVFSQFMVIINWENTCLKVEFFISRILRDKMYQWFADMKNIYISRQHLILGSLSKPLKRLFQFEILT